jgi:hypothetical protein
MEINDPRQRYQTGGESEDERPVVGKTLKGRK